MKNHYVYKSFEEEGREYIGIRSCDCLPEEDTKYFGSFYDKTFFPTEKTILFVCETRQEASEIEIELHDFFDVAVNPQFANMAKATSTGFDRTGVPKTKEWKQAHSERMSGEKNHQFGVPKNVETKKKLSEALSGENSPMFGVPKTEETRKKISKEMSGEKHPNYGRTGALHLSSKAIIVIEPDGTQRNYVSGCEAARELKIAHSSLSEYLNDGHVLTKGPRKGWQFFFKNPEDF